MDQNEKYSVKQAIMKAVMQLMADQNYIDITVTDVINRAGVARASFYRNYNTINDVIDAIVDHLFDEMTAAVLPVLQSADPKKWRLFLFEHFYTFYKRQQKIEKIRFENMSVVFNRLNDKIHNCEPASADLTLQEKYAVNAKIGAIMSITKKWLDSGAQETPEEMVDYIMSFITAF